MFNGERILIIGAHPDDEVLGCGGMISRSFRNNRIAIAILGEGSSCRSTWTKQEVTTNIYERIEATKRVAKMFNATLFEYGVDSYACGAFNVCPQIAINQRIERVIKDWQPTVVFSHFYGDTNVDHQIVYKATRIATRPYLGSTIHSVFLYEVGSSTDRSGFQPNFYVTLDEGNLEDKIRGMDYYSTEQQYQLRSRAGLTVLAQYRGSHIGQDYAEAFMVERIVQ